MQNRRKVERPELRRLAEVQGRLSRLAETAADERGMAKDAHLVATAIEYDARVISLNDRERDRFRSVATSFTDLGLILWANPSCEGEAVKEWLEQGAPDDPRRRLATKASL